MSSVSGIPSLSLSMSGQPSSSSKPSLSSGSLGHWSLSSLTPSESLSCSGQPKFVGRAGLGRALVRGVQQAVAVVVDLGAAVVVLEAVHVLGLAGALVQVVHDAVAVRIGRGDQRAAALLERAVGHGAAIRGVEDAVAVVVEVRAAVVVLEPVPVLRLGGAAVLAVEDAVAVLIRRLDLHHHRRAVTHHDLLAGAGPRGIEGALGGIGGETDVIRGASAVALTELALAELQVCLRLGEIDGCALDGAVAPRALHVGGDDLRIRHQLAAGHASQRDDGTEGPEQSQSASRCAPFGGSDVRTLRGGGLGTGIGGETRGLLGEAHGDLVSPSSRPPPGPCAGRDWRSSTRRARASRPRRCGPPGSGPRRRAGTRWTGPDRRPPCWRPGGPTRGRRVVKGASGRSRFTAVGRSSRIWSGQLRDGPIDHAGRSPEAAPLTHRGPRSILRSVVRPSWLDTPRRPLLAAPSRRRGLRIRAAAPRRWRRCSKSPPGRSVPAAISRLTYLGEEAFAAVELGASDPHAGRAAAARRGPGPLPAGRTAAAGRTAVTGRATATAPSAWPRPPAWDGQVPKPSPPSGPCWRIGRWARVGPRRWRWDRVGSPATGGRLVEAARREAEPEVRAAILVAVGEVGAKQQRRALAGFLDSGSEGTRLAAARALCLLGAQRGPLVRRASGSRTGESYERRAAIELLTDVPLDARRRRCCGPCWRTGIPAVAAAAARLLARAGEPAARAWLVLAAERVRAGPARPLPAGAGDPGRHRGRARGRAAQGGPAMSRLDLAVRREGAPDRTARCGPTRRRLELAVRNEGAPDRAAHARGDGRREPPCVPAVSPAWPCCWSPWRHPEDSPLRPGAPPVPWTSLDSAQQAEVLAGLVGRPLPERVVGVSARFLGVPYVVSPLGEGHGQDPDPLFRADAVDCLTFVEQSLALAYSRRPLSCCPPSPDSATPET